MVVFYFILGGLFIFYDIALLLISPGTFWDNVTSFTHVWSIAGLFFIFCAVYRIKKGHSFFKDCKKWLKLTIVSLFTIGASISIICLVFIFNPKLVSPEEKSDYLILLGGGIDKNGELPPMVMNRVSVAADYLKNHEETVCVVTGGTLKWLPYPEAPEIKRQLVIAGIEPERILVEDQALDTIQNFKYSCKMLADYDDVSQDKILKSDIVVVTNFFHLRRAERLAHRMGFENIKGIGAKTASFQAPHAYLREIGAYIKLNLRILLTGEPSTLGTKSIKTDSDKIDAVKVDPIKVEPIKVDVKI